MKRVLIPLFVVLAAACGKAAPSAQEIAHARTKAENGAGRLMEALFGELTAALKAGPPEKALHVCGEKAQEIGRTIQKEVGVSVRRVTLKTRNPLNTPDDYEREWLEKAAASDSPQEDAAVVKTADGGYELRYLRPLRIAKLCTQCHGEELSPAVRDAISSRYPSDRAVGYKPGDFRGAVSVRVPFD
jgi:hypothetical protein